MIIILFKNNDDVSMWSARLEIICGLFRVTETVAADIRLDDTTTTKDLVSADDCDDGS
jgi:hypothetical protein